MLKHLVTALGVALLTYMTIPAYAIVDCTDGGKCTIEESGGHQVPGDPNKTDDKPAPGKKPGKPRQCHIGNQPIPCTNTFGTWINTRQMWCKPKQPQPPNTDPIWKNNTEGNIYICTRPEHTNIADPAMQTTTWLPNTNPTPPPNPEQLAWKALATIHLQPITPGTTPTTLEQNPNALGAVGMPLWLWPRNPTPNQLGPTTASATEQGHTVTITAKAQSITWNLGNNTPPITCTTWKQPHKNTHPNTPVTCGAQTGYHQQGTYTITATTNWTIHWQGIGQQGTLHHTTTTQQTLKIGELQVLNTNPRNP